MVYCYAQIDAENIVIALSQLSGPIAESHPLYNAAIPIREYDTLLLPYQTDTEIVLHKYVEKDADGYGVFEEIRNQIPNPDTDAQAGSTEQNGGGG